MVVHVGGCQLAQARVGLHLRAHAAYRLHVCHAAALHVAAQLARHLVAGRALRQQQAAHYRKYHAHCAAQLRVGPHLLRVYHAALAYPGAVCVVYRLGHRAAYNALGGLLCALGQKRLEQRRARVHYAARPGAVELAGDIPERAGPQPRRQLARVGPYHVHCAQLDSAVNRAVQQHGVVGLLNARARRRGLQRSLSHLRQRAVEQPGRGAYELGRLARAARRGGYHHVGGHLLDRLHGARLELLERVPALIVKAALVVGQALCGRVGPVEQRVRALVGLAPVEYAVLARYARQAVYYHGGQLLLRAVHRLPEAHARRARKLVEKLPYAAHAALDVQVIPHALLVGQLALYQALVYGHRARFLGQVFEPVLCNVELVLRLPAQSHELLPARLVGVVLRRGCRAARRRRGAGRGRGRRAGRWCNVGRRAGRGCELADCLLRSLQRRAQRGYLAVQRRAHSPAVIGLTGRQHLGGVPCLLLRAHALRGGPERLYHLPGEQRPRAGQALRVGRLKARPRYAVGPRGQAVRRIERRLAHYGRARVLRPRELEYAPGVERVSLLVKLLRGQRRLLLARAAIGLLYRRYALALGHGAQLGLGGLLHFARRAQQRGRVVVPRVALLRGLRRATRLLLGLRCAVPLERIGVARLCRRQYALLAIAAHLPPRRVKLRRGQQGVGGRGLRHHVNRLAPGACLRLRLGLSLDRFGLLHGLLSRALPLGLRADYAGGLGLGRGRVRAGPLRAALCGGALGGGGLCGRALPLGLRADYAGGLGRGLGRGRAGRLLRGGGALADRRAGRLAGRAARRARRLLALLAQVCLDLAYKYHGSSLYPKRAEVCPSARCVVVRPRPPAPPPTASP